MIPASVTVRLPGWVEPFLREQPDFIPELKARMELAVELARRNVEHATGGPFGAAVFERESGRLLAAGVNLVVLAGISAAHAELIALTLAQLRVGSFDLGAPGLPVHELVTSVEPCAMCLGALPWSGVRRVVCGAAGEDAERAGFDEGAKPDAWPAELERRGIEVVRGVLRREAAKVLQEYAERGGQIY